MSGALNRLTTRFNWASDQSGWLSANQFQIIAVHAPLDMRRTPALDDRKLIAGRQACIRPAEFSATDRRSKRLAAIVKTRRIQQQAGTERQEIHHLLAALHDGHAAQQGDRFGDGWRF